ncbi:MAG: ABC transporter permease [Chloroflexota bacterium]|nr:ABC transporter permease [Chloroflexota bacterium]
MKATIYFHYTSRSLLRGGQRTVLAIFCVAVGVMAIVALQLVGLMINNAFTGNVRDANGGDIAVSSISQPFKQSDLPFFAQLKHDGTISAYTPLINVTGSTSLSASLTQTFTLQVIDPGTYPVVAPPTFTTPTNGTVRTLVTGTQVIVTQSFVDQYHKQVGDTLTVFAGGQTGTGSGRTLNVRIAGVAANSGVFVQAGSTMLVALPAYQAADPQAPLAYDTIYLATVDQAHTDRAVKAVQSHFFNATTRTTSDALKANQEQIDFIRKFLEIAGLLALLIGGVGIVNTMQVLLSRRRTEIAMLKTTGYRRFDLYALFGLEAGLLGLMGGIVGAAAAVGVSALVRLLIVQSFSLNIPFVLDPLTIAGGVLIGVLTALIFGLLPIVQAANIRPLNVLRELPEGRGAGSIILTIGMLLLLSVLFCILAIVILNNDVTLGVSAVYGAFIFLGLLSLFFGLVVFLISVLPVPEHLTINFLALFVGGLLLAGLLALTLPAFGIIVLAVTVLSFFVVFLPRAWKANVKIALRNIGRQRARTTTTMLALFVGIFTIGLILVLGQDLRDKINAAIANNLTYNVITIARSDQAQKVQAKLGSIPGLSREQHSVIAQVTPLTIDNVPVQILLPPGKNTQRSSGNLGRDGALSLLSAMEGYDVGHNQFPPTTHLRITAGRNLNAGDAATDNVLIPAQLANTAPLKGHIGFGSTITFISADGKTLKTVHVVGLYQGRGFDIDHLASLLATSNTVRSLSPAGQGQDVFYMKIDSKQVGKAVNTIGNLAPNAAIINLASIGDFINQILGYMLLTLTAIASLSLFAGIIIIANAVALAMLERRRELGILKSVGYTSRSILSEVIVENCIVGGTGALLAMLLVALATNLLGRFYFKTTFDVNGLIVVALIVVAALLAMITAALVAWRAVRVRPLEVLRYE